MTNKNIFLIIIGIILFGFFIVSNRSLKIKSIVDGSTIELNNGAIVTLIGIEPTVESKNMLNEYKGEKIVIIPDGSQYFNPNMMKSKTRYNAYVLLKSGGHINSKLLSSGVTNLNTAPPLRDSLDSFQKIAKLNDREKHPEPTPEPKPIINYEEEDFVLPPYNGTERKESHWYIDGNQNIAMLEDACDYNLPYTKSFANRLASNSAGPYNIGQVCEIFRYCFNKWRYVNDPKDVEYVARASESINASLTGDCDDFAVLIASCILAIGGDACINVGRNPTGGHAFTEVDISQWEYNDVLRAINNYFSEYNISSLSTRRDGNKLWMNLDWQTAYPGGPYYDCSTSRDSYPFHNGHWTWEKLH